VFVANAVAGDEAALPMERDGTMKQQPKPKEAMRDYRPEPLTTEEWQRQCVIDRVWQANLDRWAAAERGYGGYHKGPGDPDHWSAAGNRGPADKRLFNWIWGGGE
jgi:hypothetical protein